MTKTSSYNKAGMRDPVSGGEGFIAVLDPSGQQVPGQACRDTRGSLLWSPN
jgi:hypothetical protein